MIYYQCKFRQAAPLHIGAGESEDSDSDVMTDIRGVPFIPGSGIAGVLRTYLSDKEADWLFGPVWGGTGENAIRESRVLVSDAVLPHGVTSDAYRVSTRDGVGMNDRGTVEQGAKYDFEVVECPEPYVAVIELSDRPEKERPSGIENSDSNILERALRAIVRHGVSFGARTTRGYGRMTAEIRRRKFDFPQDLDAWLKFDPMDADNFGGSPLPEGADADILRVEAQLQMEGSFSVRRYLSRLPEPDDGKTASSVPVYGPMTNQRNRPVIPGASWAGAFRHHMRTLIQEAGREELLPELDKLFGVVEQKPNGKETVKLKSRIRFGETEMRETDARKRGEYVVTRVAVERFTGAPRNQGLFSSLVAWGGEGELLIELPADTSPDLRRLLAAALNDLHMGLLTAGGESSVGRGVCRIARLTVNDRDVTEKVNACDTEYVGASET